MNCKICGYEFKNRLSKSVHLNNSHNMSNINYAILYECFVIPKCVVCGKNAKQKRGTSFCKTCGSDKCKIGIRKHIKVTEDTKNKISAGLKLSHSSGVHPGWKHINSSKNRMSRPEKIFNELLKENGFFDKYSIEYGFSVSKYFLDFAILDLKIDIEIDGQQHFRTNYAISYDLARDNFMINDGWSVYRISAKELFDDKDKVINEFIKFIQIKSRFRKYNIEDILKQYKKRAKYGKMKDYNLAQKAKNDIKAKSTIERLIQSDINFTKYGWVIEASNIIGITPQKVNKWMKRFMPDFYDTICYKRNLQKKLTK